MLGRGVLIGWAIVALPIGGVWWLGTYLLYFDGHSDCMGELSAKLALGGSYVGIALAVGALISAWLRAVRLGWALLAIYAALLGISLWIFFSCD